MRYDENTQEWLNEDYNEPIWIYWPIEGVLKTIIKTNFFDFRQNILNINYMYITSMSMLSPIYSMPT